MFAQLFPETVVPAPGTRTRILCLLCIIAASPCFLAASPAPADPAAPSATPVPAATIDLQADRLAVTQVSKNWRFQVGDDPRWADPAFDDSAWKILDSSSPWTEQGFRPIDNLGWFRFRLIVPPSMPSLALSMPGVSMAYQIFAGGRLAGQCGSLPPQHPQAVEAAGRVFTLPLSGATPIPGSASRQILVAIRVWQDPRLANIVPNGLYFPAYAGAARPVQAIFSLIKSRNLIARGNDYTQSVISLIIGASTLVLYLLTGRGFYAWFSLNMLLGTVMLPLKLVSQHFGWGFFHAVYGYALLDFLSYLTWALFILGALNQLRWGFVAFLALLAFIAELGPIFFILGAISQPWADGIYFFASTVPSLLLVAILIRGWRANITYAKLLLIPYLIDILIASTGNLGHFLLDINVPHASALLTANIQLLSQPFAVNLGDVGLAVANLGLLAVLVYQFAESSREEQRLKSALQTAHDIQQSLVPVDIPLLGGLHTEIVYLAAEEVGGDFCQVLPRIDESILVVIGDVSGKGLEAAMVGTLAVGALRSMADENISPAQMLERLNAVLLRSQKRGFITCLCMVVSSSGQVTLANAGHLSPYLDGEEMHVPAGLPLGVLPDLKIEQTSFFFPASARLTLISDGVVEARSQTGELYGFERTSRISRLPAKDIAAEANRFGQEDDITVITLDWRAQSAAMA